MATKIHFFLMDLRFDCDFIDEEDVSVSSLRLQLTFSSVSDVQYFNSSISNAPFWSTLMGTLNVSVAYILPYIGECT